MTPGFDSGPTLESWRYWWAFNKDRFLRLREAVARPSGVATPAGADDLLAGRAAAADYRPRAEQIEGVVVPALFEALAAEKQADVQCAAMISLAKAGAEGARVVEALRGRLADGNQTIAENAALSLGILGAAEAIPLLRALFLDDGEGRAACRRKEVPWRTRAMAAYGLGLLGSQTRNPHYRARIQDCLLAPFLEKGLRGGARDVAVAAALALAMVPDRDQRAALALERYYQENSAREEVVCAHLPSAIARLLEGETPADRERYAVAAIAALEGNKTSPRLARPAFAQALGLLVRAGDPFAPAVEKALREAVERDLSRSPESAYLALMALGAVAGTKPPGSAAETFLLERALAQGGRTAVRAWGALALGVEGFAQSQRNELGPGDSVAEALARKAAEVRDPEQLAAFAVALGLRRARSQAPLCARLLEEVKVDDFRGYFALALGMMGSRDHAKEIGTLVGESARRPAVFQQGAIALGLLGEKEVVPRLVALLRDPKNQSFVLQSAVADSLGYVGDHRAVDPLATLLRDNQATASARAFAAVALGQMSDKEWYPWNAKISAHLNYFAFVETLQDLIWEL